MKYIELPQQFQLVARLGYASRGAIYLVIGGLSLMTAFGSGGQTTGSRGALATIAAQPFGQLMLLILILGLLGYAVWRLVQTFKDPDDHGSSLKGFAVRTGLLGSAITHAALAVWAAQLLMNDTSGGEQGGGSAFLQSSFGQWAYICVAVVLAIVGFAHLYKGWTARYERYMHIPSRQQAWANPVCRFGLAARGFVWCVLAWFFMTAALGASSGDVTSLSDALSALRDSSYGPWLLAVVAAGLFAFGVYSVLEALYRRIDAGSSSSSSESGRVAHTSTSR